MYPIDPKGTFFLLEGDKDPWSITSLSSLDSSNLVTLLMCEGNTKDESMVNSTNITWVHKTQKGWHEFTTIGF